MWLGLWSTPSLLFWMLGEVRFLLIFAFGKGCRGGPPMQLLNSSHVRERDKALLRSIMVGGVWNRSLCAWRRVFGQVSAEEDVRSLLEVSMGSYSVESAVGQLPANPDSWSGSCLVLDKVSRASSAGSGICAHLPGSAWVHRKWEHLDLLQPAHGSVVESCRGFCSVPGPLQTVQLAQFWSVILVRHVRAYC